VVPAVFAGDTGTGCGFLAWWVVSEAVVWIGSVCWMLLFLELWRLPRWPSHWLERWAATKEIWHLGSLVNLGYWPWLDIVILVYIVKVTCSWSSNYLISLLSTIAFHRDKTVFASAKDSERIEIYKTHVVVVPRWAHLSPWRHVNAKILHAALQLSLMLTNEILLLIWIQQRPSDNCFCGPSTIGNFSWITMQAPSCSDHTSCFLAQFLVDDELLRINKNVLQ
jgi:hypothetical protein